MRRLLALLITLAAQGAGADENDWRVPFIATPDEVVVRMLELAGTGRDDLVADLGSGDGRIVIAAARRFGARGLVQGDVLTADFSKATVVTVYLLPQLIGDLQPRFIATLKPGTRIVSHAFRMAGWRPDGSETLRLSGSHPGQGDESTLYLWIVPADVRGTWAGDGVRVRIEQNYQDVEIEGASGAVLKGAEISWQSPRGGFRGRVQGARIVGELTVDGKTRAVTLRRR